MANLTGLPVLYGLDPMDVSTIQVHPLGAVGFDSFGRRYPMHRQSSSLVKAIFCKAQHGMFNIPIWQYRPQQRLMPQQWKSR